MVGKGGHIDFMFLARPYRAAGSVTDYLNQKIFLISSLEVFLPEWTHAHTRTDTEKYKYPKNNLLLHSVVLNLMAEDAFCRWHIYIPCRHVVDRSTRIHTRTHTHTLLSVRHIANLSARIHTRTHTHYSVLHTHAYTHAGTYTFHSYRHMDWSAGIHTRTHYSVLQAYHASTHARTYIIQSYRHTHAYTHARTYTFHSYGHIDWSARIHARTHYSLLQAYHAYTHTCTHTLLSVTDTTRTHTHTHTHITQSYRHMVDRSARIHTRTHTHYSVLL